MHDSDAGMFEVLSDGSAGGSADSCNHGDKISHDLFPTAEFVVFFRACATSQNGPKGTFVFKP
jgi:hypothetical protein